MRLYVQAKDNTIGTALFEPDLYLYESENWINPYTRMQVFHIAVYADEREEEIWQNRQSFIGIKDTIWRKMWYYRGSVFM